LAASSQQSLHPRKPKRRKNRKRASRRSQRRNLTRMRNGIKNGFGGRRTSRDRSSRLGGEPLSPPPLRRRRKRRRPTMAMERSHPPSLRKKSYEQEEWYQKWLRRQKNKGRQIIEIGVDRPKEPEQQPSQAAASSEDPPETWEGKRLDPDSGQTFTFAEYNERFSGEFTEEERRAYWKDAMTKVEDGPEKPAAEGTAAESAPASEPAKSPHENEEWYQKWLRRQASKNRQIIEIG